MCCVCILIVYCINDLQKVVSVNIELNSVY